MRYWDTSGLVSLCARDQHHDAAQPLVRGDREVVTWWATRVECVSAIRQRRRTGRLGKTGERDALSRLERLARFWTEVTPSDAIRSVAERLLHRHALRAGHALQLAAAIDWGSGTGEGLEFVTFDQELAEAAAAEGFKVLPGP